MARHTSYSYTCDLCGNEMPDEGTRLVGMIVDAEQDFPPSQQPELPAAQFCGRCTTRPISDLVQRFSSGQRDLDRAARAASEA
jgi:hypothetical protein